MSSRILDVPAKHPFSLSALLDNAWNSLAEMAMQSGWTPLARLAEAAIVSLMRKITVGQLRVVTAENTYIFPLESPTNGVEDEKPVPKAELRVINDTFWVRLCAMGDLGFAEAYMYGDVECDDLVSLFQIFLDNRENLENMDSKFSFLFSVPQKLTSYRFLNTIGNSRSNISTHYDISNIMFASFLSQDMTYSCAIFEDLDSDLKGGITLGQCNRAKGLKQLQNGVAKNMNGGGNVYSKGNHNTNEHFYRNGTANGHAYNNATNGHRPTNGYTPDGHLNGHANPEFDELYEAQMCKLDHIIRKAKIQEGHRVLEIGSGWGSMAIRIAKRIPGTRIDTITLSSQQQELAQKLIAAEGLSARIQVHLMDYRSMPQNGKEYFDTYWRIVDWALKPRTGAGVVQVITIPEARWDRYRSEIDFIRKWSFWTDNSMPTIMLLVFPGGILPTLSLLIDTLRSGSKGRLVVDSVSNIGPHYARTLREWRRRFLDRFDDVIVPALKAEHPSVMGDACGEQGSREIDVFKRKWLYYYCYCEIGFTTRTLGDHIITFAREGYQDFGCDIFV
ncbi:hypothetical protein D9756_004655 [Leucocoprinus leucothites]|uniref:Cyclopropane-fatty-acyl-phospholipid synthase n=1 Tax=Leucocoprinus leucothites TaxID=201217 RepID=A0A8H5LKJ6_9AGAR|nr:hypothetical protein D9756_004655 [Leucoagaricus leucothites]